jgi:hypothetical protein
MKPATRRVSYSAVNNSKSATLTRLHLRKGLGGKGKFPVRGTLGRVKYEIKL